MWVAYILEAMWPKNSKFQEDYKAMQCRDLRVVGCSKDKDTLIGRTTIWIFNFWHIWPTLGSGYCLKQSQSNRVKVKKALWKDAKQKKQFPRCIRDFQAKNELIKPSKLKLKPTFGKFWQFNKIFQTSSKNVKNQFWKLVQLQTFFIKNK